MKKALRNSVNYLAVLFFSLNFCFGQELAGDANNDGIVNNLDIVYIGYAFGNLGPARITTDSTPPASLESVLLWEENFPDSINYIYSDADGNGFIDEEDFLIVSANYNNNNGTDNNFEYPTGTLDIDPQLKFDNPVIGFPLTAGSRFSVPISLGSRDIPVEKLNGLAFSVDYDPRAIAEVQLDFSESWANPSDDLFAFQVPSNETANQYDAAITRYGNDPVSGQGKFAALSIIIEEDLIGLFENNRDSAATILKIDKIFAVNGEFEVIPVVGDSIRFMLYHPQFVDTDDRAWSQSVKAYPTPTHDRLIVEAPLLIENILCYNTLGQRMPIQLERLHSKKVEVHCNHLPPGPYVIQIKTTEGVVARKMVVQKLRR